MNAPTNLNIGDFDETRQALVTYLQSDPRFADIDYEGANVSALINLLAYNTYINTFYRSMSHNETYRSTALLRSNVIARAAELSYVPRSFRSARAVVTVQVTSTNINRPAVVMPRGTMFTARIDDKHYTFTNAEHVVITNAAINNDSGSVTFMSPSIDVYEGFYITDTIAFSGQHYTLTNPRVDTTSIKVYVDNGGKVSEYVQATSVLGVTDKSEVYFLRINPEGNYQIEFGNGVLGKRPSDGSAIVIEYRVSSGELPNGARNFRAAQAIDGESAVVVNTVTPAAGGAVYEDVDSIRHSAGVTFATQERAVGDQDFVALLKRGFPSVVDAIAYGGENLNPPQYGRVVVCTVVDGVETIPTATRHAFEDYMRQRAVVRTPIFVDPEYVYLKPSILVNTTSRASSNRSTIETAVVSAVASYVTNYIGKFNGNLRISKFQAAIDASHSDIEGNVTSFLMYKPLRAGELAQTAKTFSFHNAVESVYSDAVMFRGKAGRIINVEERLFLVSVHNDNDYLLPDPVGVVDFISGEITVDKIQLDTGVSTVTIYATPTNDDITAKANAVLRLSTTDIEVTIR